MLDLISKDQNIYVLIRSFVENFENKNAEMTEISELITKISTAGTHVLFANENSEMFINVLTMLSPSNIRII
jgi:hypothetical protein